MSAVMTVQPPQFVAGRKFEDLVKADFASSGDAKNERRVVEASGRRGRADVWVVFDRSPGGEATASAIFEVKSTNWELIAPVRMRPNLLRMARQLWRYMDAAIEVESQSVQAYLVFPSAPSDIYIRGIVTLWWAQQETTPDEFMDAGTDGSPDALTLLAGLAGQFLVVAGTVPPRPAWLSRALASRGTPVPQGEWTP